MSETQTNGLEGYRRADGRENSGIRFINPKKLNDDGITGVVAKGIFDGRRPNSITGKEDFAVREADGTLAVINNNGNLSTQMERVEVGMDIAVLYNGMVAIKTGKYKGKNSHNF